MLSTVAEISRAFLTPLIALIALWIGYQQWRTNQNKFRFELFEKRLRVYKATAELLSTMYVRGTIEGDDLKAFYSGTNISQFLFGEDVNDYLEELTRKATLDAADSITLTGSVDATDAKKVKAAERKIKPDISMLAEEQRRLEELFKPYLQQV